MDVADTKTPGSPHPRVAPLWNTRAIPLPHGGLVAWSRRGRAFVADRVLQVQLVAKVVGELGPGQDQQRVNGRVVDVRHDDGRAQGQPTAHVLQEEEEEEEEEEEGGGGRSVAGFRVAAAAGSARALGPKGRALGARWWAD